MMPDRFKFRDERGLRASISRHAKGATMNEAEVRDRIHHLIRKNLRGAEDKELKPETRFHDDLSGHALDLLQTVMDCEDEWEGAVYITDEEAEGLCTVGDLETLVLAKLANPEEQAA